ncbi:unnamed protein product [Penicillium camemberti]|uniref:Str. FM013 n=1 Tax=Penicillium camemberti (strain FM 013) TaxID=1429867 RepID=A0A0G4PLS2_PENC3|nr:unnamed protein product [Penicillium camemberti]
MTIRWLKHGCQGAVSQQNPDSGDASTLVNGSTQAHLENKELPQPQSHQVDSRKPMSRSMKRNRDQQPSQHEGTLSSHRLSDSAEQRHSATIFPRGNPKDIEEKNQRTYTFKDCTFDGTSMVIIGGAGSMNDTVVFRDSNSRRAFFVNGGMDKETFLREVCGKM